jgi:hypothetical protein
MERFSNVHPVLVTGNSYLASLNFIFQWFGEEDRIITCEDDFLLPESTKDLYPMWPYEFHLGEHKVRDYGTSSSNYKQTAPDNTILIGTNLRTSEQRRIDLRDFSF